MLIKLIQDKTLDVTASPEKLDYSLLRGTSDWEVWVNLPDSADRRIAHVTWGYASGYSLNLVAPDRSEHTTCFIPFRQDIIPAVKTLVASVCRDNTVCDPEGPLLIRVFPDAMT